MGYSVPSIAGSGEIYSETNYIPDYGLINESNLRLFIYGDNNKKAYIGVSNQSQINTEENQRKLYDKNRVIPIIGIRVHVCKDLHFVAEARTEQRSRIGIYAGNIWEYSIDPLNSFSEYYADAMVLPEYTGKPVLSGWIKQGLRFKPTQYLLIDPYLELYARSSPTPDLGRDTQQGRIGIRAVHVHNSWSFSLLTYQTFPKEGSNHSEALIAIGGTF